ncbi:serine acetyltransferase [Sphingobacterium sp. SRCM116780]|uniref:serine O-acetyltransferase n=1 Tax=Sphingobacterium sp. SRCM116780 TaxID=2907623 RepID=UPI001F2E449D|nr:serine acetyltransferase [Sphingobacterium sp. SRCM116780]UIR56432.1 serine acetyltransferase [Sphingobacterium sp. SRCM116780]
MNNFYEHIYQKQLEVFEMPSNKKISSWAVHILDLLFPERNAGGIKSVEDVKLAFGQSEIELEQLLSKSKACEVCDHFRVAQDFFQSLPSLYALMSADAEALIAGDPAAKNHREVIRTYPGFFAISIFRIAHKLHELGVPLIPRILTEYAHSKTGIDIHPGANIGHHLYIDHGTGLVIGETCVIGNYVKLYQGVTLGALSVEKVLSNVKRHPTIEDYAIIYSGATILGGDTIVGHHSIIGGNVWLTNSVEPYTTVYHQALTKFIDSKPLI